MTNKIYVFILSIIILIISFFTGLIVGRITVDEKEVTKIEYRDLPPIHDSIPYPEPYKVEVQSSPKYIYDTVSIDKLVYLKIDTAAILSDWTLKRFYKEVLFDTPELGKFEISAEVQYNKLWNIKHDYLPKQLEISNTKTKTPLIQPFVMIGFNTGNYGNLQAGGFVKNLGLSYQLTTKFGDSGNQVFHGINIGYKF